MTLKRHNCIPMPEHENDAIILQTTRIKHDIDMSIRQLEQGECIKLGDAFIQVKQKYEE
ncbi:MAG: hypothetical protein ACXV8O_09925 [Methylobacter sp.]